jgi:hypothetical protein
MTTTEFPQANKGPSMGFKLNVQTPFAVIPTQGFNGAVINRPPICLTGMSTSPVPSPRLSPRNKKPGPFHILPTTNTMRRPLLAPLPLIRSPQRRHNSTHNARWLSEQKLRLGRLFFHGATAAETHEAGALLSDLAQNWRQYVAGAEGYLICSKRRGLYRHAVAWGEMVCRLRILWVAAGIGADCGEYRIQWYAYCCAEVRGKES